jgi:hypothetical protein
VGLGVGTLGVVNVVRRDERQLELARELDQDIAEDGLLGQPVILQFYIQTARFEGLLELAEHFAASRLPFLKNGLSHQAAHAAGHGDETRSVRREILGAKGCTPDARERNDRNEAPVSGDARRQEGQMAGLPAAADDVDLAAQDGLNAGVFGRLVERDGPEHVAMVRHCDRGHADGRDALDQVFHFDRAVEQRVLRVYV